MNTNRYWLARLPGQEAEGPYELELIRGLFDRGEIHASANVCPQGGKVWKEVCPVLQAYWEELHPEVKQARLKEERRVFYWKLLKFCWKALAVLAVIAWAVLSWQAYNSPERVAERLAHKKAEYAEIDRVEQFKRDLEMKRISSERAYAEKIISEWIVFGHVARAFREIGAEVVIGDDPRVMQVIFSDKEVRVLTKDSYRDLARMAYQALGTGARVFFVSQEGTELAHVDIHGITVFGEKIGLSPPNQ